VFPGDQIFIWDLRISQLAGVIVRARQQLIESINKDIGKLYKQLSQAKTKLTISYQSCWPVDTYETRFLKKLSTDFTQDQQRGFTSSGPHREDILVSFDSRPAQEVASRGETRTAILTLKIIELKLLQNARDTTPLLLLDDVFSELDGKRRHSLTNHLAPYQTFITTTDADLVLEHFTENCNIITL
jgi:DNA replication and repair protein RecF